MVAKKKLRVGVLFGGRSAEHEVSLVSAQSVLTALDKKKYEVIPIGISKKGQWVAGESALELLKTGTNIDPAAVQILPPDPTIRSLVPLFKSRASQVPKLKNKRLDVIIPILHGTFGEDGTIQGLLELTGIPYVGAGVLGSALGMDKIAQKQIYLASGIPTAKFDYFTAFEFKKSSQIILRRLRKLGLPVFVKPANLGSSVGISKVKQGSALKSAIKLALKYDQRIIVEQAVPQAMEIEVAVLGNDRVKVSIAGQVISSNEFYDYDAKYIDDKSKIVIPAPLPPSVTNQIRHWAAVAFKVLALAGMARVDFLVSQKNYSIYLNEVNTIPGFTPISMYPKLWLAGGWSYRRLLDELITLALAKHAQKAHLRTDYKPKLKWYR